MVLKGCLIIKVEHPLAYKYKFNLQKKLINSKEIEKKILMELIKTTKEVIISCFWGKKYCNAILILVSRNQKSFQ